MKILKDLKDDERTEKEDGQRVDSSVNQQFIDSSLMSKKSGDTIKNLGLKAANTQSLSPTRQQRSTNKLRRNLTLAKETKIDRRKSNFFSRKAETHMFSNPKHFSFKKPDGYDKKFIDEMNPLYIGQLIHKSIRHTRYGNYLQYLKITDIIMALLGFCSLLLIIIDNECHAKRAHQIIEDYLKENNLEKADQKSIEIIATLDVSSNENSIRYTNMFFSLALFGLVFLRHQLQLKILKIIQQREKDENLFSTRIIYRLIFEAIIGLIFYPPSCNKVFHHKNASIDSLISLNSIFCILSLTKLYFLKYFFQNYLKWGTSTSRSIFREYKVKPTIMLYIKCSFKEKPLLTFFLSIIIVLLVCITYMHILEYGTIESVYLLRNKGKGFLHSYVNCCWIICTTILNLAYGDYSPGSLLGRAFCIISNISGLILFVFFYSYINTFVNFSVEENNAYSKLNTMFNNENLEIKASNVIKTIMRMKKFRKNNAHKFELLGTPIKDKKLDEFAERRMRKIIANFLLEQFVFFCILKVQIRKFSNDYELASELALPIHEVLTTLKKKISDNIILLTDNFEKITEIEEDFTEIQSNFDIIDQKLVGLNEKQKHISVYLTNVFNNIYLNKQKKKNNLGFGMNYKKGGGFGILKRARSKALKASPTLNDRMLLNMEKKSLPKGLQFLNQKK